ncbi:MAG: hypothetical protein Q8N99_02755 [Nanoarchaeota archaeon]|nr:hypothetical protein [Nanoarchaeota archaeon]
MTKCTYCKKQMPENSSLEVCDPCGIKVWGLKMFNAIKSNMEEANKRGNLDQGGNGR